MSETNEALTQAMRLAEAVVFASTQPVTPRMLANLLPEDTDVDAVMAKAEAAGATVRSQPEDKFNGDRLGTIVDPFGHTWHISTHIEDVTVEEVERRMAAMTSPRLPSR